MSIDFYGYRHNDKIINEQFTYQMSINRRRMTKIQGAHASLVGIISFLLFLS